MLRALFRPRPTTTLNCPEITGFPVGSAPRNRSLVLLSPKWTGISVNRIVVNAVKSIDRHAGDGGWPCRSVWRAVRQAQAKAAGCTGCQAVLPSDEQGECPVLHDKEP